MPNKSSQWIKPYGDTHDDGRVQISFTLPIVLSDVSKEAAKRYAAEMGLLDPALVHAESMGSDFSFYILYGQAKHRVDLNAIEVVKADFQALSREEIDEKIARVLGRKLVIIGACIETDAHTVGIDAIMNMKGYNGHKGLESYSNIRAINLGAQVDCEQLLNSILSEQADVVLVSQVVTQKNIHLDNLTKLADMLEAEGIREQIILIVGGPRISHELAKELGYDAGFGSKTYAEDVAAFAIAEWQRKNQ